MRFTYIYKSSDGIRHEGKVNAPSRDEAFALLRKNGIKPIKVLSDCGSKANGEVMYVVKAKIVVVCLVFGLIIGMLSVIVLRNVKVDSRSVRVKALAESTKDILKDHSHRMLASKTYDLYEPEKLVIHKSESQVLNIVADGYKELNNTRFKLRNLFRTIYETLPEERERKEVNRLYNETNDALDLEEARLSRSKKAFDFLLKHRDEWNVSDGKIHFKKIEL